MQTDIFKIFADPSIVGIIVIGNALSFLVYAPVTVFQCRKNPSFSKIQKTLWQLFIFLTWFFLAFGAILYGLIYYRKFYKIVPILVIACYAGMLIHLRDPHMIAESSEMVFDLTKTEVEKEVQNLERKKIILDQIEQIKLEINSDPSIAARDIQLLSHLVLLMKDSLTDQEFEQWMYIYDHRAEINEKKAP